jgi:hypothetical protein
MRPFGGLQQWLDLLQPPGQARACRQTQAEPWSGADNRWGQGGEPPVHRHVLAAPQQRREVVLDQPGRPIGGPGGQGVVDGLVDQPLLLEPGGRSLVQVGHPVWTSPLQPRKQQLGEQVVVAPPAAHLVQRHQEQVGRLDPLQQLLAVGPAGDRIAQRTAQPRQHRRLQQELAHLRWLTLQHLLGEVVQDVPVAAGERRHEPGRIGAATQRQRGQLQPGDPPFGASRQRRQAGRRQLQPGGLPQQGGRLVGGEAQVGGAQLGQLPASAHPGQRQGGVGASGHHQPQLRRQPTEQQPQAPVDRWRLD